LRRGFLVLELHPVPIGEPLDSAGEVEAFGLTDERDEVAALSAAEAIEELVGRVDREARRSFLVEWTPAAPARPDAPKLCPRRRELDHVGRLDDLLDRRLLDQCHPAPADGGKLIA
jgi:hypothetical protein